MQTLVVLFPYPLGHLQLCWLVSIYQWLRPPTIACGFLVRRAFSARKYHRSKIDAQEQLSTNGQNIIGNYTNCFPLSGTILCVFQIPKKFPVELKPTCAQNSNLHINAILFGFPPFPVSFPWSLTIFLSHVQLFATPWTVACQAPLSVGTLQARILEWDAMPCFRGSS